MLCARVTRESGELYVSVVDVTFGQIRRQHLRVTNKIDYIWTWAFAVFPITVSFFAKQVFACHLADTEQFHEVLRPYPLNMIVNYVSRPFTMEFNCVLSRWTMGCGMYGHANSFKHFSNERPHQIYYHVTCHHLFSVLFEMWVLVLNIMTINNDIPGP